MSLDSIVTLFEDFLESPEQFVTRNDDIANSLKSSTKVLYDFGRKFMPEKFKSLGLPEFPENPEIFDEEQIYHILQLSTPALIENAEKKFDELAKEKNLEIFNPKALVVSHSDESSAEEDEEGEEGGEDSEIDNLSDVDYEAMLAARSSKPIKKSKKSSKQDRQKQQENQSKSSQKKTSKQEVGSDNEEDQLDGEDGEPNEQREKMEFYNEDDLERFLEDAEREEEERLKMEEGEEDEDDGSEASFGLMEKLEELKGEQGSGDEEGASDAEEGEKEGSDQEEDAFAFLEEARDADGQGQKDDEEEDEEIDMFAEGSDDEQAGDVRYDDFFDDPSMVGKGPKPARRFDEEEEMGDEEDSDEEGEGGQFESEFVELDNDAPEVEEAEEAMPEEPKKVTKYMVQQQRLQQQINMLESENVSAKEWALTGEVDAMHRPQNSLLEAIVSYDVQSKPAPVITEDVTIKLEEVIRQRIHELRFDDVQRKKAPKAPRQDRQEVSSEKSKLSLAEVYEQQYAKEALGVDVTGAAEKEDKKLTALSKDISALFAKLDALCNFAYTPAEVQETVTIKSNTTAASLEDALPVAVSTASLLAPEEIYTKAKGKMEEKMEERAKRKAEQKEEDEKHKKPKRKEGEPENGQPPSKKFKTTEVFAQLQEEQKRAEVEGNQIYTNRKQKQDKGGPKKASSFKL